MDGRDAGARSEAGPPVRTRGLAPPVRRASHGRSALMRRRHVFGPALLLVLLPAAAPAADRDPLVDRVKGSISKGIRYLKEQEGGKGSLEHSAAELSKFRPGGVTALAVVALLNAGVPANDPVIQRCLKYLRTVEPRQS